MNSIPTTTLPFFQEYDFEHLDLQRDGDLIIERLLTYGNQDEIRWLLEQFGQPRLKRWLSEDSSRRLPRRRYRLWCVLLDVNEARQKTSPIWPH